MKCSIDQPGLAKLLAVSSVALTRSPIPILGAVLLESDGKSLSATCTDMDMVLTRSAPISGDAFRACVSADGLAGFVKAIPADRQIELALDERHLTVRAGRSRVSLLVSDPETFPVLSPPESAVTFDFAAAAIAHVIDQTLFAVSTEPARHYLCGIYFDQDRDGFYFFASNGHVAAWLTRPRLPCEIPPDIIVPREVFPRLRDMADDGDAISVKLTERAVEFRCANAALRSKLIDGKHVTYRRIIPEPVEHPVLVETKDLLAGLKRIMMIGETAGPGPRGNVVTLSIDDGTLTLSAQDPTLGDAEDVISASSAMRPMAIGVNARVFASVIATIAGDTVELHIADPSMPFRVADPADKSAVFIATPYRI